MMACKRTAILCPKHSPMAPTRPMVRVDARTGGHAVPLLVFGLPTHVLLVHAVVVLVPLAVLGAVVIAVWPAARRRYGWLVVAVTVVATATVPLATEAGEALEHALPRSPAI